ncbi:Cytosine/adenosine deaminase [Sphingobium sp. AP50]|uniref:amidohydrolase family protein n=1 Tax=Sphingobium sp. AP50 TaxID=1884369 RepID=UPI0008B13E01|nr:amidohydrolase family protein [Sphingobium sp. AP50]SEK07258.1 Cytosine/adenosine deaminase [Sphingobium sp. AP50]
MPTIMNRRQASALLAAAPLAMTIAARAASPRRLLLRGANHLLTMTGAPRQKTDLLISDGRIEAIGPNLPVSEADVIDLSGHILLPGFVGTHWHMWNTAAPGLWRSAKGGFMPTMAAIAPHFTPADVAIGVDLALAEAVSSGITTVHNWAHNLRSPAHAEAEIAAMVRSGVRGRFAYGYAQDVGKDQPMDLEHLSAIARQPPSALVSIGICARGPDRSDAEVWQAEWDAARRLGLPISTHMASDPKAAAGGGIAALAARDGLGSDVQLVHLTSASRADMDRVATAGSPVSISPWTELEVGYGVPPIPDMITAGLLMGLSVDNMVLAGQANMFSVMRLSTDLARGVSRNQLLMEDNMALRWATTDGSRSLGLGKQVGALVRGMRADIIAIRLDALNTAPAADLPSLLTHAARPDNVSLVLIDGVVHKRDGRLVRIDLPAIQAQATASIKRIRSPSGI